MTLHPLLQFSPPRWLRGWSWLLLLLPSLLVILHNRRGGETTRLRKGLAFSMTHAIFYAGCLLHLSYQFPHVVLWLWEAIDGALAGTAWAVSLLTSAAYFGTFIFVHQLAQKTLALAVSAEPRASRGALPPLL